ncbi:MAG: hypothetical protein ACLPKE_24405 [Streptosporangiaceae bacterium]
MRFRTAHRTGIKAVVAAALAVPVGILSAGAASAAPAHGGSAPSFTVTRIASGQSLTHWFMPAGSSKWQHEHLTSPDDITVLQDRLYVTFQNGVGPQGQASTDGNLDSTIVEFTLSGREVRQWDLRGKCDGLTADPKGGIVVATLNEDANSSMDTIRPGAQPGGQVEHYSYSEPLPHQGGTDAISVYQGQLLVSASAPGTTGAAAPNPAYPAVYVVTLQPRTHIAAVRPLFYDEAKATVANTGSAAGKTVTLALTDPDSNEIVPFTAPRFRGEFMLTSQGDKEQIYVSRADTGYQSLSVLSLSQSVDDTAWATGWSGRIYTTDNSEDFVDTVTGSFRPGMAFVAVTPCDANNAPATCPAPPAFPSNYLGELNMFTGHISAVALHGPALQPQGMIFLSRW